MNRERPAGIFIQLVEHGPLSGPELAVAFDASPRSIYRDIALLRERGARVGATKGKRGRFWLDAALTERLRALGRAELERRLQGLLDTAPDATDFESALLSQRHPDSAKAAKGCHRLFTATVDTGDWMGCGRGAEVLAKLDRAIAASLLVTIDAAGEQRVAEPHRLIFKADHWFLAFRGAGQIRILLLDAIDTVEVGSETFQPAPPRMIEQAWNEAADRQGRSLVNCRVSLRADLNAVAHLSAAAPDLRSQLAALPMEGGVRAGELLVPSLEQFGRLLHGRERSVEILWPAKLRELLAGQIDSRP